MKYLKLFLLQQKKKVFLTLILLLGQVVGTLLIPSLVASVVDDGILKGDMNAVLRIGIQMLIVAVIATAISVWGSYTSADLGALFGYEMREKLLLRSQELSVRQFEEIGISSMVTRATSDIATLQPTLGLMFQLAVPAPIIVLSAVVMTAYVNIPMAVLLVFFTVLFLIFTAFMLKKSDSLSSSIQTRLDRINKVVRESITGVRVIRAFGNESYEKDRSGKAYESYAENMIRLNKLFAVLNPAVWFLMSLMMCAVVAIGGVFVLNSTMEIGEITAVSEYAILTLSYLIVAASALSTLPKTRSCLRRLQTVLDLSPEVADPAIAADFSGDDKSVVFDHVTFSYPEAEEAVLQDLSFVCRKGETTAIIGGTGSGKSTIADLLLRLHDIQSGNIFLNGSGIRTLTQEKLRSRIGYVPQKAFLFGGTIAENLRMGCENATDEDLWKALEIAQSDTFVKNLPLGLNAPVSQGGTNFSGGQRQRLSIARALVRGADVLVFDDSFSALDAKTDAALRKALRTKMTEPVKLIIAQRVSTILDADQILVLDEGRLAGVGTHKELLRNCSIYRDIVDSQMNRKEAE